jgi:hypothetical protein
MKYFLLLLALLSFSHKSEAKFDKLFEEKTLRLDYYHCGNATSEQFFFDELIREPHWAGSKINLVDTKYYGTHRLEMRTADTNELIYSRGYSTLFDEWQTTPEAQTTSCCYPESVVMPFPRQKVVLSIFSRNKAGEWLKTFEHPVDPQSYLIKSENKNLPVFDVVKSGNPEKMVDLVLLAEGYTADQEELFRADCRKFADELFSYAPYSQNKNKFNIRGVWAPSNEAGPDIPGDHSWNNTRLNSSFYTFDSERYLMVNDFQEIRDVAGNAPYDYIYILANTDKYGGGAIYNFYGISAAHHADETGKIYIHEFGHLFAGLGDEYVGGVEYSEFYPLNVEPWEPNLTTLVQFDKKWKDLLPEGTAVPTPVKPENKQKLGVYEGGGYVIKGVYRPWINCLMNNLHSIDVFCPVCSKSIQETIDFNCE